MKTGHIKRSDLPVGSRFDPTFHLSEGIAVRHMLSNMPYPLLRVWDVASRIFIGGRARRVYVTKRENGIPFLSSSDILQADLENVKLASKKYTPDIEGMTLQRGWTLISRSGTIGNCAFATRKHAQKLASEDVIRLAPNNILIEGVIYAFLASRYGHSMLTQGTFGNVIQHIEPDFVGNLPIPHFPTNFQNEIDGLIQESSTLREKATDLLEEAKNLLIDFINTDYIPRSGIRTQSQNIRNLTNSLRTRIDSVVYINSGREMLTQTKRELVLLKECDIKIWYPGMFKRAYVKNGYPYIKGSEAYLNDPFRVCAYLSRTKTPKLDQLWLKEGMILLSCAGNCGLPKLITKEYEEKEAIGSPDIIRIKSNDPLFTKEYLFTYFSLPAIYDYMQSLKYGSVIERFDAEHTENIPIVKPTPELSKEITEIISKYMDCTYRAFKAEEKAISMVEAEIEKWNQN